MKIKYLFPILLLLLFASQTSIAQQKTLEQLAQEVKAIYKNLDKSRMKTDFLLNQGFWLGIPQVQYDTLQQAITLPDFVLLNAGDWKRLYKGLYESSVGSQKYLPEIGTLAFLPKTKDENLAAIPIGLLFFKTDWLSQNTNKKVLENAGIASQIQPDFFQSNIYGVAPVQCRFDKSELDFYFDPKTMFFSNQPSDITGWQIDFGDGKGLRTFPFSTQTFHVSYPSTGEKSIKFVLKTRTETLVAYSPLFISKLSNMQGGRAANEEGQVIEINVPLRKVDPLHISNASSNQRAVSNVAGGRASVTLGCDGILDKPIILVEGFDPENSVDFTTDWANQYNTVLYNNYSATSLRSEGYDIIALNFNNGGDYIENNAEVLKSLINDINTLKAGRFENIVLGESMGGLVARIALKEMENDGIDHQTGLYISFDSPHQGAAVPVGVQHLIDLIKPLLVRVHISIDFINNVSGWISFFTGKTAHYLEFSADEKVQKALDILNTPAAREMLLDYYRPENSLCNPFYSYLNNLGYPARCRNIAISNGSNKGNNQIQNNGLTLTPNTRLLLIEEWGLTASAWTGVPNINTVVARIDVLGLPNSRQNITYGNRYYETAPGGITPLNQFGLNQLGNDVTLTTPVPLNEMKLCFVPVTSALDLNPEVIGSNLQYFSGGEDDNSDPKGRRAIVTQGVSPFDDVYSYEANTLHVSTDFLYGAFANIITQEIMPLNLYLQNRLIAQNRDFEAEYDILLGSDVKPKNSIWDKKNIKTQPVLLKSNARLNLMAGGSISFEPGFESEDGAEVNASIQSGTACTVSPDLVVLPAYVNAEYICNQGTYKLHVNYYYYELMNIYYDWYVDGNLIETTNREFITCDLSPGVHTLQVKVLGRWSPTYQYVANTRQQIQSCGGSGSGGQMLRGGGSNYLDPSKVVRAVDKGIGIRSGLYNAYPNPAHAEVSFPYMLGHPGKVRLSLQNGQGETIGILVEEEEHASGAFEVRFQTGDLPPGLYLYTLEIDGYKETKKLIIQK